MNKKILNISPEASATQLKYISWEAIFFGSLIIVGLSYLLNLFIISLGITVFSVVEDKIAFALVGFILLAIMSAFIMFVGGWVSGYLGRIYWHHASLGKLYGFAAWCLSLIITILLVTNITLFTANYAYLVAPELEMLKSTVNERDNNNNTPILTSTDTKKNYLNKLSFIIFALFSIGATFSALGGSYGMNYKNAVKESENI
jgi:hypothetical protein